MRKLLNEKRTRARQQRGMKRSLSCSQIVVEAIRKQKSLIFAASTQKKMGSDWTMESQNNPPLTHIQCGITYTPGLFAMSFPPMFTGSFHFAVTFSPRPPQPATHTPPRSSGEWEKHSSVNWFSQICLLSCCCCYLLLCSAWIAVFVEHPSRRIFISFLCGSVFSIPQRRRCYFFHSMLLLLTHIAKEESASSSDKWKEFVWNCSINVWLEFLYLCELFATRSWKKESQKTTTSSSLKSDKVHDALTRYDRFWLLEKTCWAFSFSYYVHEIVSCSREYEWNRASRSFFPSAAHNSQLSIHYSPRNLQSVLSSWGWHEHGTVLSIVFRLSSYTTYICPLFGALRMSHGTGRACLVRHNTLLLCVCCVRAASRRWKANRQKMILNRVSMLWVLPVPRQLTLWSCS